MFLVFELIRYYLIIIQVYVLEWNNADWWYVRKHLTEESGWVPAQYLKDEQTYTLYVQKKLVEKIEKLPVFDRKLRSASRSILTDMYRVTHQFVP